MKGKINTLDLFAGCGGLVEGFEKEGHYKTLACVEWERVPCENLVYRLANKWKHKNARNEVIRFDLQRANELFFGFDDTEYGKCKGLDALLQGKRVDIIVGGPPCQAYSLAGRVRDAHGMRDDYRNYLFESYIKVVEHYQPQFFLFENVQGMLSAAPDGKPIVDSIKHGFESIGYAIIDDLKKAIFDLTEYGIPQHRNRIIILGIRKESFEGKLKMIFDDFYEKVMPSLKMKKMTVKEAIGDLPPLYPLDKEILRKGRRISHTECEENMIHNHEPRYHNQRDINIFRMLAEDVVSGHMEYCDAEKLKDLYTKMTGHRSNVHKYYVLRDDEPSNTIPAHLYKDGLRHIHPDPAQARSITVREAARLQTFDDDFSFIGGRMQQYKMIGNAVPPKFSFALAVAMRKIFQKYCIGSVRGR